MSKLTSFTLENKPFMLITSIASFVIIVAGLQAAQSIVVPVLLSVFIAIISSPALFWLENKKVPKVLAFMIVVFVVLLILFLVGVLVSNSVSRFMHDLPNYQKQLKSITDNVGSFAGQHKIPLFDGDIKQNMIKHLDPSFILGLSGTMMAGIGGILSNAFLIFLTVAFILFETSSFARKFSVITVHSPNSQDPVSQFFKNIHNYLKIKTVTSLCTGILVTLTLVMFDVNYAPLWGLIAFFLNFIPSIGSIIAAVPAVLLTLIQHDWKVALWVTLGYIGINVVIGNVIEPKYMGKGLGLSPLVVFLSLLFWGWILGPVGMFLSVPLTMTAKIACDSNESTKWIGVLLGP